MKILLTEILNEALGVPEGLLEASRKIYNEIVKGLKTEYDPNEKVDSENKNSMFVEINGDFHISDYKPEVVRVFLEFLPNEGKDKGIILKSGSASMLKPNDFKSFDKPYKTYKTSSKYMQIVVTLLVGSTNTYNDVLNFLTTEKTEIGSLIAHELKHTYDRHKKQSEPVSSFFNYQSVSRFTSLNKFMFGLYFTTLAERLVFPSEMLYYLKDKGATKKTFLDMLKQSRIYKKLKDIKTITYDNIVKEIASDNNLIKQAKEIIKSKGNDIDSWSNEKVAKQILKTHFRRLKEDTKERYNEEVRIAVLSSINPGAGGFFDEFEMNDVELGEEEQKAIDDFNKDVEKFSNDDYERFYKYEEKKMHYTADKILRKIAKIYAYLD